MREAMRQTFDELWIIDLGRRFAGGAQERRTCLPSRTPVAIAVGVPPCQSRSPNHAGEGAVREAEQGAPTRSWRGWTRVRGFADLDWQPCLEGLARAPAADGERGLLLVASGLLTCFPGPSQAPRSSGHGSLAPIQRFCKSRWATCLWPRLTGPQAFRETRDRRVSRTYPDFRTGTASVPHWTASTRKKPARQSNGMPIAPFDRQWLIADSRLADFMRPVLWQVHGRRQVYLTSLLTKVLGPGHSGDGSSRYYRTWITYADRMVVRM